MFRETDNWVYIEVVHLVVKKVSWELGLLTPRPWRLPCRSRSTGAMGRGGPGFGRTCGTGQGSSVLYTDGGIFWCCGMRSSKPLTQRRLCRAAGSQ